ncbi:MULTISPECIES: IclR family transcriptional regulator [Halorussus]|uniref:IclR family transcriptional regulator n=1 Tax=Halorussus TaxID=1070314 RepID=UPI0020A08C11|nr:IclR family transcriptional regulator [Halorussus vallis]USZ77368.1 IclR family transcriptional regulator [Halorussus vallis]
MANVPIQSTTTTFGIVEALKELGEAGVTEIAEVAGTSKSATYKHLDTLRRLGYVQKDDGHYELGLRFFELGNGVRERNELYRIARPPVDNLAATTGETVFLVVEENGDAVCIYEARPGNEARATASGGRREPLVESIAGRALLAYRPESDVRECVPDDYDGDQVRTLRSELRHIRDRHLAIERSGSEDGRNSVAVPIRNADDYSVGALVVSGSAASLSGKRLEEDITGLVVSTAKSIEVDHAQ